MTRFHTTRAVPPADEFGIVYVSSSSIGVNGRFYSAPFHFADALFSILNTCALSASFSEFVPEMRDAALRNAGILLRVPVTRLSEANFGKLARDAELRRENSLVKRSNQCIADTAKSAQALPDGETTPVQPKARRAALAGR